MKRNKNNCDLNSCSLCRGCLKEWLPALHANRTTFDFKKGERICAEGTPVTGVYFLLTGKAKVHKKWGDKELIVRFVAPGDIIGHRGLGKEMIYPISATAIEPASACFIPLEFFFSTIKINHAYAFELLMFFAEELQESEKRMRNLAHMPVKGRLAYAIIRLKDVFGCDEDSYLNITLSKQDLASYVGTAYETVFRTLSEMVEEHLILLKDKKIKIVNQEKLAALINLNNGEW